MDTVVRLRLAGAAGMALFLAGLLIYRSYENRPVLGLWSYPFFAVIVLAALLLAVLLARSWRVARAARGSEAPTRSLPGVFLDFALLSWGLAFLLSALDDPANPGRITDLVVFGSTMPAAALIEWLALALLFVALALFAATRLPQSWHNGALAIGAVLAVVLLAEGAFRVKVAVAPATQGSPTYSERQWMRRYVELNGEGFRDVAHATAAAPGSRRILVVGDSFAFGVGVERIEDRFGEQLARRLSELSGEAWESVNFSRGNTHTLDHIGFLSRGLAYGPDVVLLLYVFNDIDYLLPADETAGAIRAPRSLLDRIRPLWLLYGNSYLFQELFVHGRLIYYGLTGGNQPDPYGDDGRLARHLEDLVRFFAAAQEGGALVALVPFEHRNLATAEHAARYRRFVERAAEAGLPVWPMTETFAGYPIDRLSVNKLDAHPNELAHGLAAAAISERILETLTERKE